MALKTFYNLSNDRRKEIISISMEEFSNKNYEKASLSNIIQNLGLAKGSFYRYFPNKKSLYLYLLDNAMSFRLNQEKNVLDGSVSDFFDMMVENFAARIRFDISFPVYSAFIYNVLQERNSEELGNIQMLLRSKIMSVTIPLMKKEQYLSQLRKDIDIELLAFSVVQLHLGIYEYLQWKYNVDTRKYSQPKGATLALDENEVLNIAKSFVSILKSGISLKPQIDD